MIQEEYVTFETAKLLKQAGFPQYEDNGIGDGLSYHLGKFGDFVRTKYDGDNTIAAPTQAQALRWLREEKEEFVCICFYSKAKGWFYEIVDIVNYRNNIYGSYFNSYEDAAEAGIKAACQYLIEKGGEA